MRRRIFLAFVLFTLAVLVLMWLFQTVFLSGLYRSVRTYETKRCASRLIGTDTDELGTEAARLADKYNICLSVYEIRGRRGDCVIKEHVYSDCFIHNTVSDSFLDSLYFDLRENGTYMKTVSLAGTRPGDTAKDENSGQTILYASLDERDGMEYMFLFNTEIYPLASTVSTIRLELVLVSVILVVIAAVLSVILSRRLARPAVKMSREASRLALGDYGVNFDGGGFREMDELASALNNASAELSELDRMQKDLIANVSHDLRTPLTLIRGYGEVMRDIPGEMNAENMQIIIDETARLSSLVSDMLDISRLMSGRMTLEKSVFSITDAVRETVERYSKLREKEGFVIDFEADAEISVKADKSKILQVIYNLVNNAINYTGEDKKVTIRQTVSDGKCKIEVIDSGCGIPESDLPLIWERYYKASEFHRRSEMGTGLGLSIVKSILVMHGAAFGVRSLVGHGSTFWFELPVDG